MKLLSIIIPHYDEKEFEVFPLLSSISIQVGINFNDIEIIIANDGGAYKLSEDLFNLFNLDIKQINLEKNLGPGMARQAGLDIAQGEYVIFCDADDIFHNVGVLGAFILEAKQHNPDILITSWLEEQIKPDGTFYYKTHETDATWMHGKMFRRSFLLENDIRFHPDLKVHEDSYFLCIATALSKECRIAPFTSYVWKYRKDSITRYDNASYTYNSMPTFIQACTMAQAKVEKRRPDLMEGKILQFILYNYFTFHRPDWLLPEHKKYLEDSEAAFVKYIKPFWHYWQEANPDLIAEVYNQERERSFKGYIENETLDAWIKRLDLNKGESGNV